MYAWNRYLQKQITDHVARWAKANDVPEERWCSGTSANADGVSKEALPVNTRIIGQRAELYNFLDNLPIEDLLQLQVPLESVLKVTRKKNEG